MLVCSCSWKLAFEHQNSGNSIPPLRHRILVESKNIFQSHTCSLNMSSFIERVPYFEPSQYILKGWLDIKSWESKSVSSCSAFGRNSFKKIKNRMHSWCSAYCTLDIKTSCFKYYKIKRFARQLPVSFFHIIVSRAYLSTCLLTWVLFFLFWRCTDEELPDLSTLTPKVSLMINESDVIDISADKHGKSANFIINLDNCHQILLSADSEEGLKERVSPTIRAVESLALACHRLALCLSCRVVSLLVFLELCVLILHVPVPVSINAVDLYLWAHGRH